MRLKRTIVPTLWGLFFFCAQGFGQEEADQPRTWQETAQTCGLSNKDISTLNTKRILIADEAQDQVFSEYIGGNLPLFITSDSILNAYHVLYEESILRMEEAQAKQLPDILRLILKNMEDAEGQCIGNPALAAKAKHRAMLVVGIAMHLLDDSFCFGDETMDAILQSETKRIIKAEATGMPEWLGKPSNSLIAIDYSRYKPRGFYTRSEQLQRYFRAVSWLQSVPFRINRDEEMVAALMLANCISRDRTMDQTKRKAVKSFFSAYSEFIGTCDDLDLSTISQEAKWIDLGRGAINQKKKRLRELTATKINDLICLAPENPNLITEPNIRILSAYRTPDAILFQKTTELYPSIDHYPSGLEVASALGSAFAREQLDQKLLKTIDSYAPLFQGNSLYYEYLDVLSALLDAPEPDAPDFMQSEAWATKSCNTALAGWAQLKHTWILQAKQCGAYGGTCEPPTGVVEPEPDFFSRMEQLAIHSQLLLERTGILDASYDGNDAEDLRIRWVLLADINRQLATIAHKQLRKVELNKKEKQVIGNYGGSIAVIMSDTFPEDDAPRIADIFSNPNDGGYLHVGIARPRSLYVLYPWKGETVLCKGAVLPYYEFVARTRLTDETWKEVLDSPKRPDVPEWLSPIIQGGKLSNPEA